MRGGKDRRAPGRREDAQAAGRLQRLVGIRVGRIVEAQLLQQRDVNGVRVGIEELGAEIDGDAPSLVLDHARIAMTSDFGSRLEEVDVEAAGKKVGRGHAARARADDRHAVSARSRPAVPGAAGRRSCHCSSVATAQHGAGAERRQGDRALDDIAARH